MKYMCDNKNLRIWCNFPTNIYIWTFVLLGCIITQGCNLFPVFYSEIRCRIINKSLYTQENTVG